MINPNDIITIIQENEIRIDINSLDFDESLKDQGLDSLDIITILFAIEDLYQVKIPEEVVEDGGFATINSMVEYVNKNS